MVKYYTFMVCILKWYMVWFTGVRQGQLQWVVLFVFEYYGSQMPSYFLLVYEDKVSWCSMFCLAHMIMSAALYTVE